MPKSIFPTLNVRNVNLLSRGEKLLELSCTEDMSSCEVDFGVVALAGAACGRLDDSAEAAFDCHEAVVGQGGGLCWISG